MAVRSAHASGPARPHPAPPDVIRCCRDFAADLTPVGGDPELLASLQWLEACLETWRRATLEQTSRSSAAPPRRLPCGEVARAFAVWLDDHPERANEPAEWLVRAALAELQETGARH